MSIFSSSLYTSSSLFIISCRRYEYKNDKVRNLHRNDLTEFIGFSISIAHNIINIFQISSYPLVIPSLTSVQPSFYLSIPSLCLSIALWFSLSLSLTDPAHTRPAVMYYVCARREPSICEPSTRTIIAFGYLHLFKRRAQWALIGILREFAICLNISRAD